MCFEPATTAAIISGAIALTTAAAGTATTLYTASASNKAAQAQADYQYQLQKQQQERAEKAALEQYNETTARNRLNAQRQADTLSDDVNKKILEIRRKQAQAIASASTGGISGSALDVLFNDYQAAVGNVSTNLDTSLQQLNQNEFFGNKDARTRAQSLINQSTVAAPFQTSTNLAGPLIQGGIQAVAGVGNAAAGFFKNKASNPSSPSFGTDDTSAPQSGMIG